MKREIKFRGKLQEVNEWREGALLVIDTGCYISTTRFGNPRQPYFGCSYMPVITKTVGQYTGLKDKNGREIYEDDIVTASFGYGFPIARIVDMRSIHYADCAGIIRDDIQVIGNIHDNPESLNAE